MKYYVVADIHGFYTELKNALTEKGFFDDKEPHKLIVCGDLLDRGSEALKVQSFIVDLLEKDEVILIRGNHEDLFEKIVDNAEECLTEDIRYTQHCSNGTVGSLLQLTDSDLISAIISPKRFVAKVKNTLFYKKILPAMINYYETRNYIFVHGWIPCNVHGDGTDLLDIFTYIEDWRNQSEKQWSDARWLNGMAAANDGVIEENKTIVCGHWNCAFGHSILEGKKELDSSPYFGKGIIAIDAHTVSSHKVNCIVIED